MFTLEDYEKKKTSYEIQTVLAFLTMLICGISAQSNPLFGIFAILALPWLIFVDQAFKKLKKAYKNDYVVIAFKQLLPDFKYDPTFGYDQEDLVARHLLKREDRFYSEDLIAGKIFDHEFTSCDVHQQDVRSNGKTTTVVTVFQGRVYKIKLEKPAKFPVYVMPSHYNNLKFREGLMRIDLESIEFNRKFDVYADDKYAAFYLLTSRMIERIMSFSSKAKRIMLSYEHNTLCIALDTRIDSLDIKLFKPMDTNYKQEIIDEMNLVKSIIEELSLK